MHRSARRCAITCASTKPWSRSASPRTAAMPCRCWASHANSRPRAASALQPAPGPSVPRITATSTQRFPVTLTPGSGCPRFASRVIRGVDNRRATPPWLRERLERSGLRSISPVVDVTNFVLLELGQPLHAYDLSRLQQGLHVRRAAAAEKLTLLDGREVKPGARRAGDRRRRGRGRHGRNHGRRPQRDPHRKHGPAARGGLVRSGRDRRPGAALRTAHGRQPAL